MKKFLLKRSFNIQPVFIFLAAFSLTIASLFIFWTTNALKNHYPSGALVSIDYAISIAFWFTLFGMWILFGLIFLTMRFTVIEPIFKLATSMQDTTSSRDWSRRISTKAHIKELESLVDDFNCLISAVEQEHNQLKDISVRDGLTGLLNRRGFDDVLKTEIERSHRSCAPFSIILIDMDRFKEINDTHGHPAGDAVLKEMVKRFNVSLRQIDQFARTGGDEFMIILPDTENTMAYSVAMKLHFKLTESGININNDVVLRVTASIGVATFPDHGQNSVELMDAVDKVLYQSKKAGRNRVTNLANHLHPAKSKLLASA